MRRWLVLLMESVVHWLWSAKGTCVLAHERVDVAKIYQEIIFLKMTMHLRQKFLWFVLEWWQHLLLSHTFSRWLILLGGHVQFVIEIVHVVLDLAELGFKLRFLVVPLEERVGSFH